MKNVCMDSYGRMSVVSNTWRKMDNDCGTCRAENAEIDLKNIYVRNVRIIGSTLRSRTPEVKAQILAEIVKNVFPKIEEGLIKPTIYKVFPIEQAEEAHAVLQRGENVGKVVLTVD